MSANTKFFLSTLILLLVCRPLNAFEPAHSEFTPIISIKLPSQREAADDLKYLSELAEIPLPAEVFDGLKVGSGNLRSIGEWDAKRPCAFVLCITTHPKRVRSFDEYFEGIVIIPIKQPKAKKDRQSAVQFGFGFSFRGLEFEFGPREKEPEEIAPNLFRVKRDTTRYVRVVEDWAFISLSRELLEGTLPDTDTVISKPTAEFDAAMTLHWDQVPHVWKQILPSTVNKLLVQLERNPKAISDSRMGNDIFKTALQAAQRVLEDAESVRMGLTIDSERGQTRIKCSLTARDGTALAESIQKFSRVKSRFGNLLQPDAALNVRLCTPLNSGSRRVIRAFDPRFRINRPEFELAFAGENPFEKTPVDKVNDSIQHLLQNT